VSQANQQLVTELNIFVSQLDEDMMFSWLDKIPRVLGYKGKGIELFIDLKAGEIDDESLRELIGVFFRYELDLFQLKQFETESNRHWFRDPESFWYSKVFECETSTRLTGGEHRKAWDEIVGRIKAQHKKV
jgi:hypothetical protein